MQWTRLLATMTAALTVVVVSLTLTPSAGAAEQKATYNFSVRSGDGAMSSTGVIAAPTRPSVQVVVPGNASGAFGNPVGLVVALVPAITVNGPGTIQVTYIEGTVTLGGGGLRTGPNGIDYHIGGYQLPLQEAKGAAGGKVKNFGALMGVFVPQVRVEDPRGFTAIDGTKNTTRVGIKPNKLVFVGESKTFEVTEPGTLFLGINDEGVDDNSGNFTVEVSGP